MRLFEETVESRVIFRGEIVTLREDTARLENGALASREVVEHPDGVCILPMEADGTVYTVRQFRYPFGEVTEELPAGKMDRGETHEAAARRELSEEVGCEAGELLYLGELLVSPGYSTEAIHMYLARELTHGAQHLDEDEFLEELQVLRENDDLSSPECNQRWTEFIENFILVTDEGVLK